MRQLYTLLIYGLLPLIIIFLKQKYKHESNYIKRFHERFGLFPNHKKISKNTIWIHAASLGEVKGISPIIDWLLKQKIDSILVTTNTPSSAMYLKKQYQNQLIHAYLPFDISLCINKFLEFFKPNVNIIMEKELWPNLIHHVNKKKIPVLLVNARIDEKSYKQYQWIKPLIKETVQKITHIMVQSEQERYLFIKLGAKSETVSVTGNLKFDIILNKTCVRTGIEIKNKLKQKRLILMATSTHEGEESLLINCYQALKITLPNLLLIIMPRHIERTKDIIQLCNSQKLTYALQSEKDTLPEKKDIYLINTYGNAIKYLASSDIVFVGGSMVAIGGHNILEPAMLNKPIIVGPFMHHFKQICKEFVSKNALLQCQNKQDFEQTLHKLCTNNVLREKISLNAQILCKKSKGSLVKHCKILQSYIIKK